MEFSVTILGTSSAIPNSKRNPSAQVVNIHERLFLIDCGEGTQIQLRKNRISLSKIHHVLISHLHGDHVYGLFGLLSTFSLLRRTKTLHLYSHSKLLDLLDFHNQFFNNELTYKIEFHALDNASSVIFEDEHLTLKTFPLKHSIPTNGFVFKEKERLRRINKYSIKEYNIPVSEIIKIKEGHDFVSEDGSIIKNELITFDPQRSRSYAYCSDTAYLPEIINEINSVDLLYHESTFSKEDENRATKTLHSTSVQAAQIALSSSSKKLLLGHFSTRYKDLGLLLDEAKLVFPNTAIAEEGKVYSIKEDEIF